ncbi:hypothetical protein ECG_00997 [Echinococcus granulosus]|uniref:Transposase n=1 Tax=Echinococcus granulosus TaxID=6210 RepID=A0A068WEN6_ECHGR|nr:hypothetical protein ECG_00997 [Echinococcus granulosus]CDS16111.1 hypothetical protein EgrG_002018000 [Echinococcus granulosus]
MIHLTRARSLGRQRKGEDGGVEYSISKLTARVLALINRSDPTLIDIFRRCVPNRMWAQIITSSLSSPSPNCHRATGASWARASRGHGFIFPLGLASFVPDACWVAPSP